jgi:hypothetical protein
MARGRDLKVSILSDVDKFALDEPADQLDTLAAAAKDAARDTDKATDELRRLALQGDDARRELERLNTEAKSNDLDRLGADAAGTATKVDNAFEKIAASSRSNLRAVDADADKARAGLDDFKSEAAGSGREAAASFSGGFDDVAGLVQETAANAFGGFGPMGAAAGIAAAAGVGIIVNKINEAKERIKELVTLFGDLGKDGASQADRVRGVIDELDPDKLNDIRDALSTTGLDARKFFDALASGDDAKIGAVRTQLEAMVPTFNLPWDDKANEARHLIDMLGDYSGAADQAKGNTELYNAVLGETPAAAEAAATAVDETAAAHDAYKNAVEGSLDEVNSSWADSVTSLKATLGDYQKALDEQTAAVRAHKTTLLEVQKEGDEDFTAWVAEQPATVAAAYAKGTAAQRASFYQSWKENVGAAASEGVVAGLDAGAPAVAQAAARVHTRAREALEARVYIPTGIGDPATAELLRVRAATQAWLDRHPNVVRIRAELDDIRIP